MTLLYIFKIRYTIKFNMCFWVYTNNLLIFNISCMTHAYVWLSTCHHRRELVTCAKRLIVFLSCCCRIWPIFSCPALRYPRTNNSVSCPGVFTPEPVASHFAATGLTPASGSSTNAPANHPKPRTYRSHVPRTVAFRSQTNKPSWRSQIRQLELPNKPTSVTGTDHQHW